MNPARPLRFLLVEDHGFQRAMMLKVLQGMGHADVLEAADGESALAQLHGAAPPVDVVITDLDMPGMDGMEFIRRMGAAGLRVSIIAVSSIDGSVLASVETMARAYGVAVLGAVSKPISAQQLAALVALHPHDGAKVGDAQESPAPHFTHGDIARGLAAGEFEAFFQPKVRLGNGSVHGFEALARWRHPDAGLAAPDTFLRAMESHALVDSLTFAMLRQAASCCRKWQGLHASLSVAVNVSVASLADVQLADRLLAIVEAEGLDPRCVILEVTESGTAECHLGPMLENLARLRMKGFGLSIDDFGTGYASVQQLGRVAFTELKIDQSFVRTAARANSSMVILQSSLDIARRLKLVSVGEGVETPAEWELLKELGCDLAQGYLIARPMEAAAVPAWLQQHREGAAWGR